ncbi:MAG: tetratricopeptide repeat protein [Flavisolibacter sp.]
MKLSRLILKILALLSVTTVLIHCNEKQNGGQSIQSIRNEAQPEINSQLGAIALKNNLYHKVDLLIKTNELTKASQLLDSITMKYGKEDIAFVYRGMIYQMSASYEEALKQYNKAMEDRKFPFALEKRASLYLEKHQLGLALEDYRTAYQTNYDYGFQLARTFQLMKIKDSAIKYYLEYLEHYPADTLAQRELRVITAK